MVQFAPPYPAMILEDESKTRFGVIGDLHLGLETSFLRSSALFSTYISEGIIKDVHAFLNEKSLENLILLGDLKHTFFSRSPEETLLLKSFFSLLEEEDVKLYLIKGNHDGRIESMTSKYPWIHLPKEPWLEVFLEEGRAVLLHGHRRIPKEVLHRATHIILGHIHPCIRVSGREASVVRVFLEFESSLFGGEGIDVDKKVLVMPASNSLCCYRFGPGDLKDKLVVLRDMEFEEEGVMVFDLSRSLIGNLRDCFRTY